MSVSEKDLRDIYVPFDDEAEASWQGAFRAFGVSVRRRLAPR